MPNPEDVKQFLELVATFFPFRSGSVAICMALVLAAKIFQPGIAAIRRRIMAAQERRANRERRDQLDLDKMNPPEPAVGESSEGRARRAFGGMTRELRAGLLPGWSAMSALAVLILLVGLRRWPAREVAGQWLGLLQIYFHGTWESVVVAGSLPGIGRALAGRPADPSSLALMPFSERLAYVLAGYVVLVVLALFGP